MQKKTKSYHNFLFLLLWSMMSLDSCLGCKNASNKGLQLNTYNSQAQTKEQRNDQSKEDIPLDPRTKLMNAVAKGQLSTSTLMQLLEQKKIDPTTKDEQGRNVVQNIIHHGTTPDELNGILQQLKQQFPNQELANEEIAQLLNTPDNSSRKDTAFIGAVEKMGEQRNENPIKLVNILFENGAKPSLAERKRSLLYCIKLSNLETSETNSGVELFKYLAQKFQDLNTPLDQATALAVASAAARAGNDDLMQYILENTTIFPINVANQDEQGNTLLHYAAAGDGKGQGSQEVIKLLLKKLNVSNPDYINQANSQGETALYVALKKELLKNVIFLLKAGAKVHSEDMAIVEELLQKNPDNRDWRSIQNKLAQIFNSTAVAPLLKDSDPHRMDDID